MLLKSNIVVYQPVSYHSLFNDQRHLSLARCYDYLLEWFLILFFEIKMNEPLYTLTGDKLNTLQGNESSSCCALEQGKVIFLPNYFYQSALLDHSLLSDDLLDGKHKNISYDYRSEKIGGLNPQCPGEIALHLKQFMADFALFAKTLVDTLLPIYSDSLQWGRTSYRPAEVKDRASSKRKDDTRVHVDSFSASPVKGLRILRVFCNVNPNNIPRVWELGEPFPQLISRFAAKLPRYNPLLAKLLKCFKVTKTLRTPYDHYQLSLHNTMKEDDAYQQTVSKKRIDFGANSTWLVFTDQVSHAALSGQYLLEQTFYLPVKAMHQPELSPLFHWQKARNINANEILCER